MLNATRLAQQEALEGHGSRTWPWDSRTCTHTGVHGRDTWLRSRPGAGEQRWQLASLPDWISLELVTPLNRVTCPSLRSKEETI